jgi:hypothetical protein
MALNLEPRHRQRRGLLLRYTHHVERTGLSLHPALEQRLSSFQEARAADALEPLAEPATAIPALEPEAELSLALPGSPASAPALPAPPPTFDPPVATASATGPVITVNNLISSPAMSGEPMRRTVDTLAVDAEPYDLAPPAAAGMEWMADQSKPACSISSTPDDPARLALLRAVQDIRRTGRCDHPGLQDRVAVLDQLPSAMRGNVAASLEGALDSSQRWLGELQAQLQPLDPASAPSPASIAGVAVQLRHCRRQLADLMRSFGQELHAPLQAMLRRQLRRARRLDWQLRWHLLAGREGQVLAPLALTLVMVLQAVVGVWRGERAPCSSDGVAGPPLLA